MPPDRDSGDTEDYKLGTVTTTVFGNYNVEKFFFLFRSDCTRNKWPRSQFENLF